VRGNFWTSSEEKVLYGKVNHMYINVVIAVIFKMVKNFTWLKSAESTVPPHIYVPLPLISLFPYPEGRGKEV
jgi:hypothetical protein